MSGAGPVDGAGDPFSATEREYGLPGWSDGARRRVARRITAAEFGSVPTAVDRFARGQHNGLVARDRIPDGTDGERADRFYSLFGILLAVADGVDADAVVERAGDSRTLRAANDVFRLLDGVEADELYEGQPAVPGFDAVCDVSRDRLAELLEAALIDLDDPRDALIRLWAEERGDDLAELHAYGRGLPSHASIDPDGRDEARRFGAASTGPATDRSAADSPASDGLVDVIQSLDAAVTYLFRPLSDPDCRLVDEPTDGRERVVAATDGDGVVLCCDDDPPVGAVTRALDIVGAEHGDVAVDALVVRGTEPDDQSAVREADWYEGRRLLTDLAADVDLDGAALLLDDLQVGRQNAAAIADLLDAGSSLYVLRGRWYDRGEAAETLDAVRDAANGPVRPAVTCLRQRDAVATLDGQLDVRFAAGFPAGDPEADDPDAIRDPDARRAVSLVDRESGTSVLLPGDVSDYDVLVDGAVGCDVVDCQNVRNPEVATAADAIEADGGDTI